MKASFFSNNMALDFLQQQKGEKEAKKPSTKVFGATFFLKRLHYGQ
jgi:hypothetical protein